MNVKTMTASIITAMIVLTAFAAIAMPASAAVEVQIGLALDGSGSIIAADWTIIKEGLASAVEDPNCVPDGGTVELTVVQFADGLANNAKLEVGPVVITSANAGTVANNIRGIVQGKEMTPMAHGIHLTADTMKNSANFHPSIKQVINIATDGEPNVIDPDMGGANGVESAELARDYAITTLAMTNPDDEIDAEGIAITIANRDWLKDEIVYPQPGNIAPPYKPGWVRVVANAQEFAESTCEKFEAITPEPEEVPAMTSVGIAALIGMLGLIGAGMIMRRR